MINSLKTFRSYSKYYDLIYQKKNYKKEVDCIVKLLKKFKFKKKNYLNLAPEPAIMQNFLLKKDIRFMGLKKVRI